MSPSDQQHDAGDGPSAGSPKIVPFTAVAPGSSAGNESSPPGGTTPDIFSVAKLFHRLNRILPEDQVVVAIPPSMGVAEALKIMKQRGFSQLPVVEGSAVLGVFSHRSFSEKVPYKINPKQPVGEMAVEEFIEKPRFARLTDEFKAVFRDLDESSVVLIGEDDRLQGVVTTMDVLNYLHAIANHYVLIAEIEITLRALISHGVDEATLVECCSRSLATSYEGRDIPTKLVEMSFNDYVQIVGHGLNWDHFHPVFGGIRQATRARLEEIRDLRNDIFHFRREVTMGDHEKLAEHRDWLLRRARIAEERVRKGGLQ